MATSYTYRGSGNSLEAAVKAAHAEMPKRVGVVVCRVLEWGYQVGGYVPGPQFYALVCEGNLPPE
jgi:hypothetical protein